MTCEKCGRNNLDDARFCRNCGAKLATADDAATIANETMPTRIDDPAIDNLVGQTVGGKYRLDAILGKGGMGTVYVATRLHIGDTVAVKILHREFMKDPSIAERFRREAHAAARLKHPNAVGIYDFGVTSDGSTFLVMELLEGQSLRQVIKKQGALDLTTAAEIIRQVCAALEEAHRRNIVHRDIKPDNIILNTTPSGHHVKVLDFGIAKLRDISTGTLTQTGTTMGTPQYMSPEQCLGQEVDSRSDIYSLGIVLYEMLCGATPFNATTPMGMAVQQVNNAPPSLCARSPRTTPAVEAAVLHMLQKQPEARTQTATLAAQELLAAVRQGTAPAYDTPTQADFKTPLTSPVALPASGTVPVISQPPFSSTPGPQTPVSFPVQTVPGITPKSGRKLLFFAFGAVLLVVVAGALATSVYMYLKWQRANEAQAKRDNGTKGQVSENSEKDPTPNPSQTPVSVDEQLDVLNERRMDATPGQLPDIDEALQALEEKYPSDYRFTYVRAKIADVGSHAHRAAFALLFLAGQKAIDAGKAAEMLKVIESDSDRDFYQLAHGHSEWKTLEEALKTNNKSRLRVDVIQ
jgi:serine/threonine-protein kinase